VKSKASPGPLVLGTEVLKQLGDAADRNLLVRWMAEHLADLLKRHGDAKGSERARLARECSEIILKIWSNRHHLPGGARPLEQFEPLFSVISQLQSGEVRHPMIRVFGVTEVRGKGSELFNAALAIDKAATSLIRYSLAEMAAGLAKKDKAWVGIAKEMSPRDWDMEIIFTTHGDSETLVQKKERLKKREIEDIEAMMARLELLETRAPAVRKHLEAKLKVAKKI
jgi:hypothetical protein